MKQLKLALTALILATTTLFAQTKLTPDSIQKEMSQILKDHVTQKEMTRDLLKKAVKHYIEQFDPYKVYLLSSEVTPYLTLSDNDDDTMLTAYKENKFPVFYRLNALFEKSVKKLRAFRRGLLADPQVFAELSNKPIPTTYATTDDELLRRHAIYMAQLVEKEMADAKKTKQDASFKEAVRNVELELEENENLYLFCDRQGKPLDTTAKNETIAFLILKALSASLDAHTRFLNPQEAQDLRMKLEKNYTGVGIGLNEVGSSFVIRSIIKGSSADATGVIQVGDELIAVDKKPVSRSTLAMVQEALEGAPNTTVELELKRPSTKRTYIISLERREIELKEGRVDTTFEKIPDGIVGIIALHAFYQGSKNVTSEKDVLKALDLLHSQGKVKGIILDLRDNKGGFLSQAVKVAGLFIKSGVVVVTKYAKGELRYFRDLDSSVAFAGPLIVLISKETASAAEIVAEALKDYGVAIIVGDKKSFGKGSIQFQTVTKDTNEADSSYFKVTVGRYYGVSGKSTQLDGVKADIVVPSFLSQRKFGEEYLSEALQTDSIAPSYKDTLSDIPPQQQKWYQKYYVPFIQPQVETERKLIPELAKRSAERMAKETNYTRLLQGATFITEQQGLTEQKKELDPEEIKRTILQYQLQETVNIMKDMISLESK